MATMITKVLTRKGQTKSINDTFTDLLNLNPTDPYKEKKAAGSLGGSLSSGFLSRKGQVYTRMR